MSDGDSDASDEEVRADSVKLNKIFLMASGELQLKALNKDNEVDNDDSSDTANATMRKRVCKRRWLKQDRETFTGQHFIPTSIIVSDKVQAAQNPVYYFELFFDEPLISSLFSLLDPLISSLYLSLFEQSNLYAGQKKKY